jgi:hypothetical protein
VLKGCFDFPHGELKTTSEAAKVTKIAAKGHKKQQSTIFFLPCAV